MCNDNCFLKTCSDLNGLDILNERRSGRFGIIGNPGHR